MQISLVGVPNRGVFSPGDVNYWGWARQFFQQGTFALRKGRFSHLEKLFLNTSFGSGVYREICSAYYY